MCILLVHALVRAWACCTGKCAEPSQSCQRLVDLYFIHSYILIQFLVIFSEDLRFNIECGKRIHIQMMQKEKKKNHSHSDLSICGFEFNDCRCCCGWWCCCLVVPIFSNDVQCIRAPLLRDFSLNFILHNVDVVHIFIMYISQKTGQYIEIKVQNM